MHERKKVYVIYRMNLFTLQLYFSYKYLFYKTYERICLPSGIFLPLTL